MIVHAKAAGCLGRNGLGGPGGNVANVQLWIISVLGVRIGGRLNG